MKDEIIKNYEWDLDFFLNEAARCTIAKNNSSGVYEKGLNGGGVIAFMGAAYSMTYRLKRLCPDKYLLNTTDRMLAYIKVRIDQLIKEKTNEAKSKLHKD